MRARLGVLALLLAHAAAAAPPAEYGTEARVALSRLEARAMDAVRARLRPAPRSSPALVLAARELAARAAAGARDLPSGVLRAALARARAYDPSPASVLVSASPGEVLAEVARTLPRRSAAYLGAGAVERDGTAWVVVLLSDRRASIDPFPRDVAPGARAVLSGTLAPPLERPRVFVTRPSGEVVEPPPSPRAAEPRKSGDEAGGSTGRAFRVPLEFPAAGRHVVEIVGEGPGGPEVAALLTVAAGGASLEAPPRPPPAAEPRDVSASEAAVLAALNATRARHRLAPVAADPAIATVARRHSEAMAVAGRPAHVLPGSPDVGTRLRSAGIAYRGVYENVSRAGTALEAHASDEDSPAHLGNVLRPDATRAGIGIARARLPSGDPIVYLTEILVRPPDDGAESRLTPDARVREALWRERSRAGLPPLTADPALDALARDAAAAMRRRDETETDGLADRALALHRQLAAVDVFVAGGPEDAVRSSNLRDRRFGRVGVGVVPGDSKRYGRARLWIAVLYTD